MIVVIASITVAAGKRAEFLELYLPYAATVLREEGCLEYRPLVDEETDLPVQQHEKDVVTVLEKWASLETLQGHLESAAMQAYKESVQGLVEKLSLKVLHDA